MEAWEALRRFGEALRRFSWLEEIGDGVLAVVPPKKGL
jgi:hypothetical protein